MILKEYEFLQYKDKSKPHFIKEETFEAIEKFVLDNEATAQYLKITTKKGFGKVLQAQNYVGIIQAKDGTTIEILPKIQNLEQDESKKILIKMLKTLKNSPFRSLNTAHLKSTKMPLFEIFITMFLEEVSKLIKRGIKSDYVPKEENIKFLKGKLKISEQIKHNSIHKERFFVAFEEFSNNRAENRLIKTTLNYLYKKSRTNTNQQRIREFLFIFDDIPPCKDIKTDFLHVKPNRQMKDYEQVLLWCKTFLLENAFSPYRGNDIAYALLFDMNFLFESYVYDYLRRHGKFETITAQDKTYHLAYEEKSRNGKFRLKPDIVIKHASQTIIADTKWKMLSKDKINDGISQGDLYQLYAYGTKYQQCKTMFLIYPKDKYINESTYDYFNQVDKNLNLQILFFDLTCKEQESFIKKIQCAIC